MFLIYVNFIFLYYLKLVLTKLWRIVSINIDILQTIEYLQLYRTNPYLQGKTRVSMVAHFIQLQYAVTEINLAFFMNFFLLCICGYCYYTTPTIRDKTFKFLLLGVFLQFLILDFALFLVMDFNNSLELIESFDVPLGRCTFKRLPYLFFIYI